MSKAGRKPKFGNLKTVTIHRVVPVDKIKELDAILAEWATDNGAAEIAQQIAQQDAAVHAVTSALVESMFRNLKF